jgi:hypothetical protein
MCFEGYRKVLEENNIDIKDCLDTIKDLRDVYKSTVNFPLKPGISELDRKEGLEMFVRYINAFEKNMEEFLSINSTIKNMFRNNKSAKV